MLLVPQADRLELPMEQCQLWNNKDNYNLKYIYDKSIGDNFMDSTLPWGGVVLVCSEESTDDMIGSAVCSSTSADVSCGWSADWWGDGACCVWISSEERDDSTWIGDNGRGQEGGAVFWRFSCDLVLLGPFLLTWLDWGASALVLVVLVFADLPDCCYNKQSFMSPNMKECW